MFIINFCIDYEYLTGSFQKINVAVDYFHSGEVKSNRINN